ncbi:uncharacterized protein E5676_scaffold46G00960 [Cucumis melo var. makuwa]|uniref:Uncharacterized protein n=1 Tax=Cucumis melo var. makuwa TaxID=1194695 RepID=A0A5D3BTF3_CUCMM|nr:uncharacterized protein E5676_scaffold46G00960 [Cucumis melo var. makuwa]
MFDPFFTIFSAGDGDYNFNIDLQELSRLILADDDLFLTILVPRDGKFRSLASLDDASPKQGIFATASTSQVKFYGRTADGEIIGATLLTAEVTSLETHEYNKQHWMFRDWYYYIVGEETVVGYLFGYLRDNIECFGIVTKAIIIREESAWQEASMTKIMKSSFHLL